MTDRDDRDMKAWADRALAGEPAAGRVADDLARAHAGLTRRRRWTAGASGIAVAAVAFAIAMAPSLHDAVPSGDGGTAPSTAGHSDEVDRPAVSAEDRALLDDCGRVAGRSDETITTTKVSKDVFRARRSTAGQPVDLGGWTVVDREDDAWGTTAILLSPDGDRWGECTVGVQAGFFTQAVRTPPRVPRGFVQQPDGTYDWKGGDSVSWAQQCIKSGTDCGRDLYFMTTRLPIGVDSITMKTYDDAETRARVTDGFALIRTFGPVLNDYPGALPGSSTTPPIILTYRAPDGDVLSRYNSEFLPPIPDGECEGTGGC